VSTTSDERHENAAALHEWSAIRQPLNLANPEHRKALVEWETWRRRLRRYRLRVPLFMRPWDRPAQGANALVVDPPSHN